MRFPRRRTALIVAASGAVCSLASSIALGVDRTWDGFASNIFALNTNWTLSVAPLPADAARFRNQAGIVRSLVIVDANRTVAAISIDGTPGVGAYEFQRTGGAVLTSSGSLNIGAGGLGATPVTFNGLAMNASSAFVRFNATLTLSGSAQLSTTGQISTGESAVLNIGSSIVNANSLSVFGNSAINVNTGGNVTAGAGAVQLTDAGSRINVNSGGNLTFNGSSALFGGTLTLNASGTLNIGASELDTDGPAFIQFNRDFVLPAGKTLNIKQGGDLASTDYVDIGVAGAGTMIVDGAGSSVNIGTNPAAFFTDWGNGGTATVTFSNSATGDFNRGLQIAAAGAGTQARVNLNSGASLNVDRFLVTGGGTNVASITINSATLSSTGTSEFRAGSTVALESGTLSLGGNATFLTGSTLNRTGGNLVIAPGTTLAIAGGTFNNTSFGQGNGVTVAVTSGGKLDNSSFYDVANAVATGTLLVDGAGSRFTAGGFTGSDWGQNGAATVTFSNSGAGTVNTLRMSTNVGTTRLNLASGGNLNVTGSLDAGGNPASNASITINGGALNTTGSANFRIGTNLALQTGTLALGGNTTFSTGASLSQTGGAFNMAPGATTHFNGGTASLLSNSVPSAATLLINNAGKLTASQFLSVGNAVASTLIVDGNNSSLEVNNGSGFRSIFGNTASGNGTATFSNGAVGTFVSNSELLIGNTGGTAKLNVLSGANVHVNRLNVGDLGGLGTVLVDGVNSRVLATTPVNGASRWAPNSGDAATLTFANSGAGSFNAGLLIGTDGGAATVNVQSSAQLSTASLSAGRTSAGASGGVNINISGGTLNSTGAATFANGANVTVTGTGVLQLGGNSTFSTGSTFSSPASAGLELAANRTLAFDGGAGTVQFLFNGLRDGQTLRVTNGGQFTALNGLPVAAVGNATVLVDGPGSRLVSATTNTMTWGQDGFATVTFSNGGAGTYNGGMQIASANQALVNITSGGLLHMESFATTFLGGTATFNVNGGTLRTTGNVGLNGGATVNYAAGTINVGGTLEVNQDAEVLLTSGANKVLRVGGLTMSGTSTIDLADNDMIVDYTGPSPIAAVRGFIAAAHANGAWTGSGLGTSMGNSSQFGLGYAEAAAIFSSFPATYAGQQVDNTSVLVGFTRYGDANLDGTVNLSDFNALASSFGQSGKFWSNGDFNYDGTVNLSDFNLLAANFGLSASGTGVTPEDWATLAAAVPEPTAIGFASIVAATTLLRRRSRKP